MKLFLCLVGHGLLMIFTAMSLLEKQRAKHIKAPSHIVCKEDMHDKNQEMKFSENDVKLKIVDLRERILKKLMCLADLEFDYINPYDSASRINFVILPEFVTHGVLCLIFLVTGHWVMCLLALPYLYYNLRLYTRKQHLVDVTEIFNQLDWEKKQRLFKLGYLVSLLFITLFWMIYNSLEDDEM